MKMLRCESNHSIQKTQLGAYEREYGHRTTRQPVWRQLRVLHSARDTTLPSSDCPSSTSTINSLGTCRDSCSTSGTNTNTSACNLGARDWVDRGRTLHRRQLLVAAAQAAAAVATWSHSGLSASTAAAVTPLGGAAATSTASSPLPSPSSFLQPLLPSPSPDLLAQLEGRAPIFQPGVAWALRNQDRQLFYPPWLVGEWEVTARFAAASFPQGRRLLGRTVPGVLKGSMVVALPDVGAAMDVPVRYRARFLESPDQGGVVADRVFNVQQLMDAFYGFGVTRKVEYEPLKNPTRLTVVYATPRQEKSVISEDLRKAELIINNRISEQISPTDFICAELFRQISQASAQGFVGDYEIISRYTLLPSGVADVAEISPVETAVPVTNSEVPDSNLRSGENFPTVAIGAEVRVLQRVAAFLQPQDAAFFEAGNQAVAAYDYTYTLRRLA